MANGGFIGKRLVPNLGSAKGVWTANELYHARLDGIWPLEIVEVVTDFLIIAGGGGGGSTTSMPGGGAGGYLNSYGSEASGRNSASLSTMVLQIFNNYAVTIGAGGSANNNGSNSSFSGTDSSGNAVSYTAIGGGAGHNDGNGNSGGSGGASGVNSSDSKATFTPGSGTSNQGFDGGLSRGEAENQNLCNAMGGEFCECDDEVGGGGGGAGGAGVNATQRSAGTNMYSGAGGAGLASSITGTSVTRAAGGSGRGITNTSGHGFTTTAMPTGSGPSSPGGGGRGGSTDSTGGNGIIILRYPNVWSLSNPGGGLTISTAADGSDKVSSITAGTGNIQFGV